MTPEDVMSQKDQLIQNMIKVCKSDLEEIGLEITTMNIADVDDHRLEGVNEPDLYIALLKRVQTVNADSGVILGACKHVTVSDVVIKGRKMHHCLAVSWGSDCLFTRWRIEAPHVHGTTISWCAHGNVFKPGKSAYFKYAVFFFDIVQSRNLLDVYQSFRKLG